MKIENLRSEKNGSLVRIAATAVWEDCDRPTQEIYFETQEPFAQGLACNPHAFLVGCIMPAMHNGEGRVSIDAEICPELRNGLITAMSWICQWFELDRKPVRLEAKIKTHLSTSRPQERAGVFFSGGIDSLASLRANRLNFPLEHPGSFKDGLLIHGIEKGKDLEFFKQVVNSLSVVALDAGINLIPVYTNIRHLDYDSSFWGKEFQGAVLSAVAHAFSQRLTAVSIPSSFDIYHLYAYGSHPLLDPNYSSSNLRIRHDDILLTRLDKTKLVADWDAALQNLRVCNKPQLIKPGALNCGQCEKCLRTMLALLALGVLDRTQAFPKVDISEELIMSKFSVKNPPYGLFSYQELLAPLAAKDRYDLVRGIKRAITRYNHEQKLKQTKERLRQTERQFFKGNLLKFYRALTIKA